MRHLNKGRSLSRSTSHRKALLANLAQELFLHKRIQTTLAKAKELRPYAEKLVTTAKKGHLAARRQVREDLSRAAIVKTLFDEIAPIYADRPGGYTRIIKLGQRIGDNAPLAIIELVGFETIAPVKEKTEGEKEAKQKTAAKKTAAKKTAKEGKKSEAKETKAKGAKKPSSAKQKSASGKARSKSGDRG